MIALKHRDTGEVLRSIEPSAAGVFDFSGLDLAEVDFSGLNLRGANFTRAVLYRARFKETVLSEADFSSASPNFAEFNAAQLQRARFAKANLLYADFTEADLSFANLSEANLSAANLASAEVAGVEGLLDPSEWMAANLKTTNEGYLAFTTLQVHFKTAPAWRLQERETISCVTNQCRTAKTGSGIPLFTEEWVLKKPAREFWLCLIPWAWLPGVVVPFDPEFGFRASRVRVVSRHS